MKWLRVLILFPIIFFMICRSQIAISDNSKEYKIAIIHSNNIDYFLENKEQNNKIGFLKKLNPNMNIRSFFMNYNAEDNSYTLQRKAALIDKKIKEFNPDLIITNNNIVFEYYNIPYIYKQNKNNSLFLRLKEKDYNNLYKKYELDQYKQYIKGCITTINLKKINSILSNDGISLNNIYIIKNDNNDYDDFITSIKTIWNFKKIEIFNVTDTKQLKDTLNELNKKETGIIIDLTDTIIDENFSRFITDKEFAEYIISINNKHLELSIYKNLTKYGFGISNAYYNKNPESENVIDNILIKEYYQNSKLKNNIFKIDSSILVNLKRITKLNLKNFFDDLTNIDLMVSE